MHRDARPREHALHPLLLNALHRALRRSRLLENDLSLVVDLLIKEQNPVGEVTENRHRLFDRLRLRIRHEQLINRLLVIGMRVRVRPETHSQLVHVWNQLARLEVLRTIERHVLQKVRQPVLRLRFIQSARVDMQEERRAIRRILMLPDDVRKPIVELPIDIVRVARQIVARPQCPRAHQQPKRSNDES